jgi:hypothetical protein
MKFPKTITSNRGCYKYTLNETALIGEEGYVLLRRDLTADKLGKKVLCHFKRFTIEFHFYFHDDGYMDIGCRRFNLATTRILRQWAGV